MGFPGKEPASAADAGDLGKPLGQDDPLEEEMATHSNILAWKILWTEDPGGATIHVVTKELDTT